MSSKLNRILWRMPYLIRNLMASAYGFNNSRIRYGGNYQRYRSELTNNLGLELDQLLAVQRLQLQELLLETLEYSPYYAGILSKAGITAAAIQSARRAEELLERLPLLSKEMLRRHLPELLNRNPRRRRVVQGHTSGSTGTPLDFEIDYDSVQFQYAVWRRFHDLIGLPQQFHSARFSGRLVAAPQAERPPFWVHNFCNRQLLFSVYHMTEANLSHYLEELNRFQPQLLDGFPSALYILAEYMLHTSQRFSFRPTAVATTAETLFDWQREAIAAAFGCQVYNQYASSEGSPWIAECRAGGFHLLLDTGVFEFSNQRLLDRETSLAELVVTGFVNHKLPLLRYQIGDMVLLHRQERTCHCGLAMPLVKEIVGRQDDIIFTMEKGYLGRVSSAFKQLRGIKLAKIIQHELARFEVQLVPEQGYTLQTEQELMQNLRERLGQKVLIELRTVKQIPLDRNGKFKAVERRCALPN